MFATPDPISFVNRKIANWIRTQRGRHGEHDDNDSRTIGIVALAGTSMTSSTYGSVSFNLTFFNEINELNETIISIKVKVRDSCMEVIIDRPVIRSHDLIRKILSYFDEIESRCQSSQEVRPYEMLVTHVYTPDVSTYMRSRWGLRLTRIPYG